MPSTSKMQARTGGSEAMGSTADCARSGLSLLASVVQDDLLQGWAAEGPWIADLSIYPAVTNRIRASRYAAWEVATLDGIVQDAPSISETTSKWLAT